MKTIKGGEKKRNYSKAVLVLLNIWVIQIVSYLGGFTMTFMNSCTRKKSVKNPPRHKVQILTEITEKAKGEKTENVSEKTL